MMDYIIISSRFFKLSGMFLPFQMLPIVLAVDFAIAQFFA